MGRKSIISDQQKIKAVTSYLNGKDALLEIFNYFHCLLDGGQFE